MTLDDMSHEQLEKIRRLLVDASIEGVTRAPDPPRLVEDLAANAIVTDLHHLPHAFVYACLVDRQMSARLAWKVPLKIQEREDTLAFDHLAHLSEEDWVRILSKPDPVHRWCKPMGVILHRATQRIADRYDGDASRIWNDTPTSARLVRRFLEFHGAGPKIATMAANILVRDFKISVADRRYIDVSADVQVQRVMSRLGLVRDSPSPEEVIYAARELHPDYPGIFDLVLWQLGQTVCRAPKA